MNFPSEIEGDEGVITNHRITVIEVMSCLFIFSKIILEDFVYFIRKVYLSVRHEVFVEFWALGRNGKDFLEDFAFLYEIPFKMFNVLKK